MTRRREMTQEDHCHGRAPQARKKWRNSLYVCECGQAWQAENRRNYAGDWWVWVRWPK